MLFSVQTAIPNLPKSSTTWTKDFFLCTRELDLSSLCCVMVEHKYFLSRQRLEKLCSTEAVEVPIVSAI